MQCKQHKEWNFFCTQRSPDFQIDIAFESSPASPFFLVIEGVEVYLCSFFNSALDGVGGQRHAPTALPSGKIHYALHRRLGGPQSRSGRVRRISPPPGFDHRTVQPVASRYTDWAIPAPKPSV